ncbi:MAG: autotransporter-associated beta strand repeat-containing protein [Kiritimatiellae bacterium]|nr:autotransporter-associated beta strand repeat-containing protein [Kiritimatiellia bacterium]
MRKTLLLMVVGLDMWAQGADFYLKSGASDWTSAASYCTDAARTQEATAVPGSADTVFVPEETFALSDESDSFAVFANVKRIAPEGTNSVIELTVNGGTADEPRVLNTTIYHALTVNADRTVGTVVKKGAGFLYLAAKNSANNPKIGHTEYGVNFDVREGTLRFAKDEVNNTYYGFLKVASGAAVWFPQSENNASQAYFDYILAEEGSLLTNATARSSGHVFGVTAGASYDVESYIKGAIGGGARIWTTGTIRLEMTANTCSGSVTVQENLSQGYAPAPGQNRGVILVKKFGNPGATDSSLGTGNAAILCYGNGGGGFRYIGEGGETTSRNFDIFSQAFRSTASSHPAFLDAGPNGGVTFTGAIRAYRDSSWPYGTYRLWLMGDNANECVYGGSYYPQASNGVYCSTHVTKKGSGRWRLANNSQRNLMGAFSIQEGELAFDSIAEKGGMCALGLATILTPDDSRTFLTGETVDWAYALGDPAGVSYPSFTYTGNAIATCTTRPLALVGAGGTLRASAGQLTFGGVSARDAGTSPTLTLDGTGTENELQEVSDGATGAKVNLAKTGAGIWTLGGNLTFSGKIDVRQGTLAVDVPKPHVWPTNTFTWFRLSFAQIGEDANPRYSMTVRQIGLYDKDGVRQNVGLTQPVATSAGWQVVQAQTLAPGQVWFDNSVAGRQVSLGVAAGLAESFREADGYNGDYGKTALQIKNRAGNTLTPTGSDPATWIPIVMRLPEGSNPITHFDIQGFSNTIDSYPTRFKLEGSSDGRSWHALWSNVEGPSLTPPIKAYNSWVSDGVSVSNASHPRPYGKGFNTAATEGESYTCFNWYRLSFAQLGYTGDASKINIRQIGLYNSAGERLNEGLTDAESLSSSSTLTIQGAIPAEGQVGFDASVAGYKVKFGNTLGLASAFDGVYNGNTGGLCNFDWFAPDGSALKPNPQDRTTWVPIVMHLAGEAQPVTHFDVQYYNNTAVQLPTRLKLEGSLDGRHWTTVYDNATQGEALTTEIPNFNCWVSDGVNASNASHERPIGKGLAVSRSYPADPEPKDQFAHVESVSVAAGATLTSNATLPLAGLTVDAAGAGTLQGFTFAANGTLDVRNLPAGGMALPGTYLNCEGLENLANWQVSRDGTVSSRLHAYVRNGVIYVTTPGLTLNIR